MRLRAVITQTTLRVLPDTTPLDVVVERSVLLATNLTDALNVANAPSAANPFATMADVNEPRYARIFMLMGN
jgi:hypothetical protein